MGAEHMEYPATVSYVASDFDIARPSSYSRRFCPRSLDVLVWDHILQTVPQKNVVEVLPTQPPLLSGSLLERRAPPKGLYRARQEEGGAGRDAEERRGGGLRPDGLCTKHRPKILLS